MTAKLNLPPLDGLEIHPRPWCIHGEVILCEQFMFIDPLAYDRLKRGEPIEDVFKGATVRVLDGLAKELQFWLRGDSPGFIPTGDPNDGLRDP